MYHLNKQENKTITLYIHVCMYSSVYWYTVHVKWQHYLNHDGLDDKVSFLFSVFGEQKQNVLQKM